MKLCSDECYPICDFCKHYDFNPGSRGEYVNKGYCRFHKKNQDPLGECDDFECGMEKMTTQKWIKKQISFALNVIKK